MPYRIMVSSVSPARRKELCSTFESFLDGTGFERKEHWQDESIGLDSTCYVVEDLPEVLVKSRQLVEIRGVYHFVT